MSERADDERRLAKIEEREPEYDDVPWLIAELRAAWAREDEPSGPVMKRKLALAGIEHAGYRRGLAAARAALEKLDKYEPVFEAIAVIDALAAGARKEDGNG